MKELTILLKQFKFNIKLFNIKLFSIKLFIKKSKLILLILIKVKFKINLIISII